MAAFEAMDRLAACLKRLPGVGRRSAERMALRLIRDRDGLLRDFAQALEVCARTLTVCSQCGTVTTPDRPVCALCAGPSRDDALLCVVEQADEIALIEASGGYHGRYHALMGRISPARGTGPSDVRLQALLERLRAGAFKEIILALGTDLESDATAGYLAELLKREGYKVSRLARGLPAGSGIAYSDPVTLDRALRGRTEVF